MTVAYEVFDEWIEAWKPMLAEVGRRMNEFAKKVNEAFNRWSPLMQEIHGAEVRRIHTNYRRRQKARKRRR